MAIETILFDLDDTLFPKDSGVWPAVLARIKNYMREQVGIPAAETEPLRKRYHAQYGTSLRGLYEDYRIDRDEYLAYVHDVPIERFLKPNSALGEVLGRLPQRKWVFTNSSTAHSRRVLATLGVEQHFEGIVDTVAVGYRSKPDPAVYPLALQTAGVGDTESCLFLDDQAANLEPARQLGIHTVLVGNQAPNPAAEYSIPAVETLLDVLPWLVE